MGDQYKQWKLVNENFLSYETVAFSLAWCYVVFEWINTRRSKYARYLQFLRKREQLNLVDLIVGYFNNLIWR